MRYLLFLLERLLDMLSIILSGQSYKPLGAPGAVRADILNRDVVNAQVGHSAFLGNFKHIPSPTII